MSLLAFLATTSGPWWGLFVLTLVAWIATFGSRPPATVTTVVMAGLLALIAYGAYVQSLRIVWRRSAAAAAVLGLIVAVFTALFAAHALAAGPELWLGGAGPILRMYAGFGAGWLLAVVVCWISVAR